MVTIRVSTTIAAPIERCFDLSRSIDLHIASTEASGEKAVAGVTSGLIGLGQEVTWNARHFGVSQLLTSRITAFERPTFFQDRMVRGSFKELVHDHFFEANAAGTIMKDVLEFTAPLGILGWLAERLFLQRYMESLLKGRNRVIKEVAESGRWKDFLGQGA